MGPPGDLVFYGIAFSILVGAIFGFRIFLLFFFSIGMLMIFQAFFQWANIDGSWPKNQPRNDNYQISKEKDLQLNTLIFDANGKFTDIVNNKEDMEDYKRCRNLNVCVRKFQQFAEPR